jgi:hypothetical protein
LQRIKINARTRTIRFRKLDFIETCVALHLALHHYPTMNYVFLSNHMT